MSKILLAISLLVAPALAFAQASATPSAYRPATVTQVKPHMGSDASDPSQAVYEVSVKVDGTTYVVLTKSPSGDSTILYAIGRELLVQVGDKVITWNDILGQSHEAQIISRDPIVEISKSSESQK